MILQANSTKCLKIKQLSFTKLFLKTAEEEMLLYLSTLGGKKINKHHSKRKLQINITNEYICKNSQRILANQGFCAGPGAKNR